MRYTSSQILYRLAYHINDIELTTNRDLGVLMSNDLCWKHHYENLLMRAYKYLGLLRRIFCNISCSQAKIGFVLVTSTFPATVLLSHLEATLH